jgi:hypothetical protein
MNTKRKNKGTGATLAEQALKTVRLSRLATPWLGKAVRKWMIRIIRNEIRSEEAFHRDRAALRIMRRCLREMIAIGAATERAALVKAGWRKEGA